MPRKIIWIGGPHGVGKSSVLRRSVAGKAHVMHNGKIAEEAERELSKNPAWRHMTHQQRTDRINLRVVKAISKALDEKNSVVLDSHYSHQGKPMWYKYSLSRLASIPNVDFMLVHLTVPKRELMKRIIADVSRSRDQKAHEVLNDILLNQRFYEEYREAISKKATVRGITLWNEKVQETADLLSGFVDSFLSEKWKNSFLVPVKRK